MSVNKVILIGRVGKDPEIRSTQDGREVANFSVATSEYWKDKNSGERKEKTEWHKISVFNQGLIGVIKSYVKKGSKIYVEGSLQTRKWQDQSGKDCYSTEVVLQAFNGTLQLLDSKSDDISQHSQAKGNGYAPSESSEDILSDEVPF